MRRPLIAGNWKMNLDLRAARNLLRALRENLSDVAAEVAVCPPFTLLAAAAEELKGAPIRVGAQDLFWEKTGAYTGEVSAEQLVDIGCSVVLIGHSERRRCFGETDDTVARKLKSALRAGLMPVVCVGETLEEREGQKTYRVLQTQLKGALSGLAPAEAGKIVVAYEPVWAIGTGKTATPTQAQDAHLFIRKTLATVLGSEASMAVRILYGGSVKPDNADALMAQPDIDGALVGGESLKPVSFLRIIHFQAPAEAG
ncbi:MAG: triose-phosphate isomerase [Elusimicrobia bacterium]|nr:triose-phosphate isomerase [Elusimicrobiota bacterium]MDE2312837.1 triose-phosphate isomerase [Elusimicrobiota bacterium]